MRRAIGRAIRRSIRRGLRTGVLCVLASASVGAPAATAETTPGFCEARAALFRVRAVNGLHRVVREGPNQLKIAPLGVTAVCTFLGAERPARFATADAALEAARRSDKEWLEAYGDAVGPAAEVLFNDVRPAPLADAPFYYVTFGGAFGIIAIGVHADPTTGAFVSSNCFIQHPVPEEALGLLLMTTASVYFEPADALPECETD